jgi:hypothetical protein
MNNPTIIQSQLVPQVDVYVQESLKPYPVYAICPNPNCGYVGPTKVSVRLNTLNCLFASFCGLIWTIINAVKRKEMSCHDADHHCLRCGTRIGNYETC